MIRSMDDETFIEHLTNTTTEETTMMNKQQQNEINAAFDALHAALCRLDSKQKKEFLDANRGQLDFPAFKDWLSSQRGNNQLEWLLR